MNQNNCKFCNQKIYKFKYKTAIYCDDKCAGKARRQREAEKKK